MHVVLDLVGIFAFGVSGALMAIRRDFDVVGIAILALVTALGGGIIRDLVLGDTPPPAFTRWEYLFVPLAAAAVAFVAHPEFERLAGTLLVFDAAGLGLFAVAGTVKALDHGLAPLAAAILGVTTAVGGGVVRDVIARETPALVRADSELYVVPALAGALAVATAIHLDADHPALPPLAAVAIFGIRLVAMNRHWHGPRAWRRRGSAAPTRNDDDLQTEPRLTSPRRPPSTLPTSSPPSGATSKHTQQAASTAASAPSAHRRRHR
jgi:uncharacterized membrane protein YeiH